MTMIPVLAAGVAFTCMPVRVWDGDGPIWCAEGPKIRLAGIAAREMDGTCRPGHPCPTASAEDARNRLVRFLGGSLGQSHEGHMLVRGPRLQCRSMGSAGGSRTAAWCGAPGIGDLSCAMIRTGTVARWDRYWRGPRCSVR
jgi:endonuclease YncB( thermonuclease family)